jgi:ubiquinone/menaquinone biosynthesis C-methylase UbiE
MKAIRLPRKENHPVVGDNLTKYYHLPLIRYFFIKRLTMTLEFLDDRKFDRILEIGYGSGVLLPELSRHSNHLFGLDIHNSVGKVKEMLIVENIETMLTKADVLRLPYKDESFDCVISIATLEHIKDLSLAILEIKRILRKGGIAVFGFPVANKLSDSLLILTGSRKAYQKRLSEIHPSNHQDILSETKRQFGDIQIKKFPFLLPLDFSLYCSCMARKC